MQYITISVQDVALRQRNSIAVEYERILIPMLNNLKWPTMESKLYYRGLHDTLQAGGHVN